MQLLHDLLSLGEQRLYNALLYPLSLSVLSDKLKECLKEDCDKEIWTKLVYYKYVKFVKDGNLPLVNTDGYFISNKGRIAKYKKGKIKIIKSRVPKEIYPIFYVAVGNRQQTLYLHRALACSFLPLELHLLEHPKNLQVNHKDGDKLNYTLDNLEWVTQQQNIVHAYDTGLQWAPGGLINVRTKPVKGTFLFGPDAGFEFVLTGNKDMIENGFMPGTLSNAVRGVIKHTCGCSFVFANEEEVKTLPRGIGDKTLPIKKVLVCTHRQTKEVFEIEHSWAAMEKAGFSPKGVWKVLKGQRNHHKQYTFQTY